MRFKVKEKEWAAGFLHAAHLSAVYNVGGGGGGVLAMNSEASSCTWPAITQLLMPCFHTLLET